MHWFFPAFQQVVPDHYLWPDHQASRKRCLRSGSFRLGAKWARTECLLPKKVSELWPSVYKRAETGPGAQTQTRLITLAGSVGLWHLFSFGGPFADEDRHQLRTPIDIYSLGSFFLLPVTSSQRVSPWDGGGRTPADLSPSTWHSSHHVISNTAHRFPHRTASIRDFEVVWLLSALSLHLSLSTVFRVRLLISFQRASGCCQHHALPLMFVSWVPKRTQLFSRGSPLEKDKPYREVMQVW